MLDKWEFGSLKALSMERWTAADFEKGSNYPVTLVVARQDNGMTADLVSGQLTSCPRRGLQM